MKSLLTTTALFEAVTGLGLAIAPSFIVSQLLGTSLTDPSAVLIGRLAGAALITIAIACWLSRNDSQTSIMVKAMLSYNVFALTLLVYAAIVERISGPALWPAVLLHFGLLFWCFASLRKTGQKGI
jgi:hypothetical protein